MADRGQQGDKVAAATDHPSDDGKLIPAGSLGRVIGWEGERAVVVWHHDRSESSAVEQKDLKWLGR